MEHKGTRKRAADRINDLTLSLATRVKLNDGCRPSITSDEDIGGPPRVCEVAHQSETGHSDCCGYYGDNISDDAADATDDATTDDNSANDKDDSAEESEFLPRPPAVDENDIDEYSEYPYLLDARSSDDSRDSSDSSDIDSDSQVYKLPSDSECSDSENSNSDGDDEMHKKDIDTLDNTFTEDSESDAEKEIAEEEAEYDDDPERLENSDDDSTDERAEFAEHNMLIPKLIRDSMRDLAYAQGYVSRIAYVYTRLGICDNNMQEKLAKFRFIAHELDAMELQSYENCSDDEPEDSSDDESKHTLRGSAILDRFDEDVWKLMDKFTEKMWRFVQKYSGYPPPLAGQMIMLDALDDAEGIMGGQDVDGDIIKYHRYVLAEAKIDCEPRTLREMIDDSCNPNRDFVPNFLDEEAVFEHEELDNIVPYFRDLTSGCSTALSQFAARFPKRWEQFNKTDSRFSNYRALDAIRNDQESSERPAISSRRMRKLIMEVFQEIHAGSRYTYCAKLSGGAVSALSAAAEDHVIKLLRGAGRLSTSIAGRQYVETRDLQTVSAVQILLPG